MKNPLNSFFNFSNSEKKAVYILLTIILVLLVLQNAVPFFISEEENFESVEKDEIEAFFAKDSSNVDDVIKELPREIVINEKFNPDTLTLQGWQSIGFSEKEAKSILKFKNVVGGYNDKATLKKSYVISEKDFEAMLPYLVFNNPRSKDFNYEENTDFESCYVVVLLRSDKPVYEGLSEYDSLLLVRKKNEYLYCVNKYSSESEALKIQKELNKSEVVQLKCSSGFWIYPKKQEKNQVEANLNKIIEINKADTSEFKSLTGVGSYYAKKIVIFRDKLGGFYSVEQISEVYGINPDVVSKNRERLKVNSKNLKKLNINKLTDKELKKHPYISWQIANSIYFYRLNHGNYNSIEDVTKSEVVTSEIYEKMKPYLTIEE